MFNKTIFITGVAGLIGSHLALRFLALGHKVIGVDNLIGGYDTNLPRHDNFSFHHVDILDNKAISNIMAKSSVDTVIHCAALAHEGLSVFSPNIITKNIFSGTISIATAAIANNVRLFINTSSMARYGNATPPFYEHTQPQPIDPYGLAKLQAEQQLNLLSSIHKIKVIHIVPHNVSGPHQCYSDPFRNVMSIFANRISNNVPVYIYGDGEQKRSFSHVEDCINAYVKAYEKADSITSGEVFNIGPSDGSEITIKKLASIVAKYFNSAASIIHLPDRPQEVKNAWVSTTKAENILNYTTQFTTEDVVRDTITWIKVNPKRDFDYHLDLEIVNDSTPKTWTDKLFNE